MPASIIRFVSIIAACLTVSMVLNGCATTVDQRIGLSYSRLDRSFGSRADTILVTRVDSSSYLRNESGEWVLGSLNNVHGVHQANLLSNRLPGDWVTDALLQELKKTGFNATYVTTLPEGVAFGITLGDIKTFLDVDTGLFSDDTRHELKFNVHVIMNGQRVKTFNIASRDSRTFPFAVSRDDKELIMLQSLQDALQQFVPEIVSLIDSK